MNYQYRIEGQVEKSFIIRGHYYPYGSMINLHILESELNFMQKNVKNLKIISLENPSPILKTHNDESVKEVKTNVEKPKRNSPKQS